MNSAGDNGDSDDSGRLETRSLLLDAALELAGLGFSVFPLTPGSKVPRRGSEGFHDATTDTLQVREWWTADTRANIGVRTSGLAVVDLDLYHPRSAESWVRLLNLTGPDSLLDTWVSRTGRGGKHYWYQLTDSRNRCLKNGYASCLPIKGEIISLPHIDLKCCGGSYVVAPPSVLPEGIYHWIRRNRLNEAPEWLRGPVTQLTPPAWIVRGYSVKGSARRVAAICEVVAAASVGERNNTLNWAAFRIAEVVAAGVLRPQQAHDALVEAAIEVGLPLLEAKSTIRSAFKAKGVRHLASGWIA